jgi:hypothetical protein
MQLTYNSNIDWRDHTAEFYSGPNDIHFCTSIESSVRSIPFCAASCNSEFRNLWFMGSLY